jgi:hypothetical protein
MRPDPEQTISACQPSSSITRAINLKKAHKQTNKQNISSNRWVALEGDGNKNTLP